MARAETGREAFAAIFRYLYAVADESVTLTLYTTLTEQSPEAKDALMTSAEQRARIEACTELGLLDRWHRAALTVESTSELFASSS